MSAVRKTYNVVVDSKQCKGCGYCAEMCPRQVYELGTELNGAGYEFMTVAQADRCVGCLACVMACPDFAISVEEA